jgi:hypothetical protein
LGFSYIFKRRKLNFTVVTDDDGIVIVVPGDVRLGETNHLASQPDGESDLDPTVARPHRELRRHRRLVIAATQAIQLPERFPEKIKYKIKMMSVKNANSETNLK